MCSALKNKVGEARAEPNISPTLPEPEGRLSLDMNPIVLLLKMVGPDLRRKIICGIVCALCLFLCVMLAPMIIGNLISTGLAKLFGL